MHIAYPLEGFSETDPSISCRSTTGPFVNVCVSVMCHTREQPDSRTSDGYCVFYLTHTHSLVFVVNTAWSLCVFTHLTIYKVVGL